MKMPDPFRTGHRPAAGRLSATAALVVSLVVTAGCAGQTPGASSASAPSQSSAASSATKPRITRLGALHLSRQQPITLAPGASRACAAQPTSPTLSAFPAPAANVVPPTDQLLVAPGQGDGPWQIQARAGHYALLASGFWPPTSMGYVYFNTQQSVPAGTKNVVLCAEYYDAHHTTSVTKGDWLTAQFSGTNTAGPSHGAYDNAPEVYATTGTHRWLVASFTMSGINFAKGDKGAGMENNGTDFRIQYNTPTYFDRFWLVTKGVPTAKSLAAMNTAALSAFVAKYH